MSKKLIIEIEVPSDAPDRTLQAIASGLFETSISFEMDTPEGSFAFESADGEVTSHLDNAEWADAWKTLHRHKIVAHDKVEQALRRVLPDQNH